MKKTVLALLIGTAPLLAQAEEWKYAVSPYVWLPTIKLDSPSVFGGGADDRSRLDVGPTNYLDALNFALMVNGEARKGDTVVMGDLIYLNFGVDDTDIRPGSPLLGGRMSADLKGSIVSLAGGKTLIRSDNYYMDGLIGWRRFGMDMSLSWVLNNNPQADLAFNDVFLAVNGRHEFGSDKRWFMNYYGDVGTGESKLTWQASAGVGYKFGWGELFANYRHLEYKFGDVGPFRDLDAKFSGPSIGATFRF